MKLTDLQIKLMREAGISITDPQEYKYLAEDEDKLADLLINSLGKGQQWTEKAQEVENLLNYLADY